jgi:carotenoid 1,2-hydratase
VFSPYYAWARRRGTADPLQHCAVNVALHGPGGKRWAMTERGRKSVTRTATTLGIGSSALAWDGETLTVTLDEVTAPWPTRIRGTVRLHAAALTGHVVSLDGAGAHRWQPIAPCARVEVALSNPSLRWSGQGYFDSNTGDAPLEDTFAHWHWSRACLPKATAILYDIGRRDGAHTTLALHCDVQGIVREFPPPPAARLPATRWRIDRATRTDDGSAASVTRTLEDSPFYARSLVASQVLGKPAIAVHESLSLTRFRAAWVRMLLPFRMPRVG